MNPCAKVVGLRHLLTTSIVIASTLFLVYSPLVCAQQNPPAQPTPQSTPEETAGIPPTFFPHPENVPWWVSGQINIIFQGHLPFHAPYTGLNSLKPEGQAVTSTVVTLYTGYRFDKTTEVLFDVESASGHGISDALGLAGFTNLDVVRNPELGIMPYIARAMLRQIVPLGHVEDKSERT